MGDTVTLQRDGRPQPASCTSTPAPSRSSSSAKGETDLPITLDKPGSVDVEEHASETLVLRILVS